MKKDARGFTLIELLVVIAIIGILATVVLASLSAATSRARDARRKSEMKSLQTALELYYAANGRYPSSGGATAPDNGWTNSVDGSWTVFSTAMAPYIKAPQDPMQTTNVSLWAASTNGYTYSYFGNCGGKNYLLVYHLENASGPDDGAYCGSTFYQMGGVGTTTAAKTIGIQ